MSQPKWRYVANLGDASPLDYGGLFVYEDETGVYAPECERLERDSDDDSGFTVHRWSLDKCTFINGVLSDNKFHPDKPAWFAKPESEKVNRPQDTTYLSNVEEYVGSETDLTQDFCSDDILVRARAYESVGSYHGFVNLDSYPLKLTAVEANQRYLDIGFGKKPA